MVENEGENKGEDQESAVAENINPSSSPLEVSPIGFPKGLRVVFVVGGVFLSVLLLISIFQPGMAERVKFFTVNALSLLVLMAIIVQVIVYRRQWEVMQEQRRVMGKQLQTMRDSLAQNKTAMEKSWLFANAQGLATREQLLDMKEQTWAMRGQLEAIKTQNATLEKSIEIGEMSSIYAQRAYVTASVEKIEEFQFHLRIENSGNTPANDVHVAFSFGMRDKPPYEVGEDGLIAYDADWAHKQRLGLIAPGGHQPVITPKQSDPFKAQSKLWDKWKLSQVRYYVWGRIFYEDIFNKKRHTDFCFFQGQGFPSGYPCEYGNSAI